MEDNLSQEGMFGGLDLQGSLRIHHLHPMNHQHRQVDPSIHVGFPLSVETMHHHSDQSLSMNDYKGDRCKSSMSDDNDEPSYTEEGADGHNDPGRGKKGLPWQRVKWTDKMVRLLITAVSYVGEDVISDCGGGLRRKSAVLQKKGKWKSISKVMAERGFHVSPQQCEDKFNDLNKRYKKLNDMLGRGISCQVVENPALLDVIDYITEKEKDDVKKILSSKQLFYEEMCSYHNKNRLHLPHDPALKRSLQLALKVKDDNDNEDSRRHQLDLDEDDHDIETDRDEFEEFHASHGDSRGACGVAGSSSKRLKQCSGQEDDCLRNFPQDGPRAFHSHPQIAPADTKDQIPVTPENVKTAWVQKQLLESRTLQLEEQKVQIQVEMLELEKQRFQWQRFSKKRDRELEKMKVENERMKLENERMALELKRWERESTGS